MYVDEQYTIALAMIHKRSFSSLNEAQQKIVRRLKDGISGPSHKIRPDVPEKSTLTRSMIPVLIHKSQHRHQSKVSVKNHDKVQTAKHSLPVSKEGTPQTCTDTGHGKPKEGTSQTCTDTGHGKPKEGTSQTCTDTGHGKPKEGTSQNCTDTGHGKGTPQSRETYTDTGHNGKQKSESDPTGSPRYKEGTPQNYYIADTGHDGKHATGSPRYKESTPQTCTDTGHGKGTPQNCTDTGHSKGTPQTCTDTGHSKQESDPTGSPRYKEKHSVIVDDGLKIPLKAATIDPILQTGLNIHEELSANLQTTDSEVLMTISPHHSAPIHECTCHDTQASVKHLGKNYGSKRWQQEATRPGRIGQVSMATARPVQGVANADDKRRNRACVFRPLKNKGSATVFTQQYVRPNKAVGIKTTTKQYKETVVERSANMETGRNSKLANGWTHFPTPETNQVSFATTVTAFTHCTSIL